MNLSRSIGFRQRALTEVPALTASLALAELFFKFHSFTLEFLAFVATWWLARLLSKAVFGGQDEARPLRLDDRRYSAANDRR